MSEDQQNPFGSRPDPEQGREPAPSDEPTTVDRQASASGTGDDSAWAPTESVPNPEAGSPEYPAYPSFPPAGAPSGSGYGTPAGEPPVYGSTPGYGTTPGYGAAPDYGQVPPAAGYGQTPGYEQAPGSGQVPGYSEPAGYPASAAGLPGYPAGYPVAGPPTPVSRPGWVIGSVVLQIVAAAFTLLSGIALVVIGAMYNSSESMQNGDFVQDLLDETPGLTQDDLGTLAAVLVVIGIIIAIIAVVMIWVAVQCTAGKNWARITATAVWAVLGLITVTSIFTIIWVAALIVCLWLPDVNNWFKSKALV